MSNPECNRMERKETLEDKLDRIIELLEKIDQNTTPIITWPIAPSVWVNPQPYEIHDNSGGWTQGDDWVHIPPTTSTVACTCKHCKEMYAGRDTTLAGGCIKCGCRLVSIYMEDGSWWCNRCHRESYYQDGSMKPQ